MSLLPIVIIGFFVLWLVGCVREGWKNLAVLDVAFFVVSFRKVYFMLGASFDVLSDMDTGRKVEVLTLGAFFFGIELRFIKMLEGEGGEEEQN